MSTLSIHGLLELAQSMNLALQLNKLKIFIQLWPKLLFYLNSIPLKGNVKQLYALHHIPNNNNPLYAIPSHYPLAFAILYQLIHGL